MDLYSQTIDLRKKLYSLEIQGTWRVHEGTQRVRRIFPILFMELGESTRELSELSRYVLIYFKVELEEYMKGLN